MGPEAMYSSLIAISFLESSLAFPMWKVARIDAKVSQSCSNRVILVLENIMITDSCACNMVSNTNSVRL